MNIIKSKLKKSHFNKCNHYFITLIDPALVCYGYVFPCLHIMTLDEVDNYEQEKDLFKNSKELNNCYFAVAHYYPSQDAFNTRIFLIKNGNIVHDETAPYIADYSLFMNVYGDYYIDTYKLD